MPVGRGPVQVRETAGLRAGVSSQTRRAAVEPAAGERFGASGRPARSLGARSRSAAALCAAPRPAARALCDARLPADDRPAAAPGGGVDPPAPRRPAVRIRRLLRARLGSLALRASLPAGDGPRTARLARAGHARRRRALAGPAADRRLCPAARPRQARMAGAARAPVGIQPRLLLGLRELPASAGPRAARARDPDPPAARMGLGARARSALRADLRHPSLRPLDSRGLHFIVARARRAPRARPPRARALAPAARRARLGAVGGRLPASPDPPVLAAPRTPRRFRGIRARRLPRRLGGPAPARTPGRLGGARGARLPGDASPLASALPPRARALGVRRGEPAALRGRPFAHQPGGRDPRATRGDRDGGAAGARRAGRLPPACAPGEGGARDPGGDHDRDRLGPSDPLRPRGPRLRSGRRTDTLRRAPGRAHLGRGRGRDAHEALLALRRLCAGSPRRAARADVSADVLDHPGTDARGRAASRLSREIGSEALPLRLPGLRLRLRPCPGAHGRNEGARPLSGLSLSARLRGPALAALARTARAAAPAESLEAGRLGSVSLFRPSEPKRGFVFLFSDLDGFDSDLAQAARTLAAQGMAVVGVDLPVSRRHASRLRRLLFPPRAR